MRTLLPLMLALCAVSAAGAEVCYPVQSDGGQVRFEVHQDNAPFTGLFHRYGGRVCFEGDAIGRIDVWLDPASVDTGLPEVDETIRGPLFFETERYPRISFVSDRISPRADDGNWTALGTITVKNRDNPLEVPFTLRREEPGRRVSGELDLDRLRYGVGTGEWSNTEWLGGTVTLYYEVPLGLDPLGN